MNISLYKTATLIVLCLILASCAGTFYSTPHEGVIWVELRVYVAKDSTLYTPEGVLLGKHKAMGAVIDTAGNQIGMLKHIYKDKGNTSLHIYVNAQGGKLYTLDSTYMGSINEKGKIFDSHGYKLGQRKASTKELMDYFEKEGYPYDMY